MEKVYVKRDIYDGILGLLEYWLNDWWNKGTSCVEEVFDLGLERIGNLHKSDKYAGKKLNKKRGVLLNKIEVDVQFSLKYLLVKNYQYWKY